MAFNMNGSPAKMGTIQGAAGHVSALKMKAEENASALKQAELTEEQQAKLLEKQNEQKENEIKTQKKQSYKDVKKQYGKNSREAKDAKLELLQHKQYDREGQKGGGKQWLFGNLSTSINKKKQDKILEEVKTMPKTTVNDDKAFKGQGGAFDVNKQERKINPNYQYKDEFTHRGNSYSNRTRSEVGGNEDTDTKRNQDQEGLGTKNTDRGNKLKKKMVTKLGG
jgi:hypothetical protein